MALVKCKECGAQVSSKAKSCPSCGASVKSSLGCGGLLGAIILGAIILGAASSIINSVTPKPQLTEEQKAAEQKAGQRIKVASAGAIILKKHMKDPDSFKLVSALVIEKTGAVCYEYRAKNSFGAVVPGSAVLPPDGKNFKTDEMQGFTKLWNKECAGKDGVEVARGVSFAVL